jgi:hypothetical protein
MWNGNHLSHSTAIFADASPTLFQMSSGILEQQPEAAEPASIVSQASIGLLILAIATRAGRILLEGYWKEGSRNLRYRELFRGSVICEKLRVE